MLMSLTQLVYRRPPSFVIQCKVLVFGEGSRPLADVPFTLPPATGAPRRATQSYGYMHTARRRHMRRNHRQYQREQLRFFVERPSRSFFSFFIPIEILSNSFRSEGASFDQFKSVCTVASSLSLGIGKMQTLILSFSSEYIMVRSVYETVYFHWLFSSYVAIVSVHSENFLSMQYFAFRTFDFPIRSLTLSVRQLQEY